MTLIGFLQILLYLAITFLLVKPLGSYIARVYTGQSFWGERILGGFERAIYRVCGIRVDHEMTWKQYFFSMLGFNFLGFIAVYSIQCLQFHLPFNTQGFSG